MADREYKHIYHKGIEKANDAKKRYEDAGMRVLDGTVVDIEGVRFWWSYGVVSRVRMPIKTEQN